ncbi:MAG: T9SS type A sorting domain-containing protein [Bacteroidota bacterium]
MKKIFTIILLAFNIPVFAQPTTIQIPVMSSADDADESVEDNIFVNPGDMQLDNPELEMIYDNNVLRLCHLETGIRFTNVTIPQGATIVKAYIQFTCKQTGSDVVNLIFSGQNSNNAAPFASSSGNISTRPLTTASVNWVPLGWYTTDEAGLDQRTPSLVPVVQEIVNRTGWISGNAMAFVVAGSGDTRSAYAYDGDAAKSAVLYVQYSGVGLDENIAPINAVISPNPCNGSFTLSMNEEAAQKAKFRIFDQMGSEIQIFDYSVGNIGTFIFNISDLSKGIYYLSIVTEKNNLTKKVVIF